MADQDDELPGGCVEVPEDLTVEVPGEGLPVIVWWPPEGLRVAPAVWTGRLVGDVYEVVPASPIAGEGHVGPSVITITSPGAVGQGWLTSDGGRLVGYP